MPGVSEERPKLLTARFLLCPLHPLMISGAARRLATVSSTRPLPQDSPAAVDGGDQALIEARRLHRESSGHGFVTPRRLLGGMPLSVSRGLRAVLVAGCKVVGRV